METAPQWYTVVLLGFGTVFIGLICLIYITLFMSFIMRSKKQNAAPAVVKTEEAIADRGALVAAACACIAETMGTSVNGLRVLSIKKVN